MHDRYRELVASLPIPTDEQTERFAEFVVRAHSWYKHLSCRPPGAAFAFYLDPDAGRELVETADGGRERRDRVDGQQGFHYTWMTTNDYLERFGHWSYATDHGTQFLVQPAGADGVTIIGPNSARIWSPAGDAIAVSPDVLAAGTMGITAYVHQSFLPGMVRVLADSYLRFRAEHPAPSTETEFDRDHRALVDLCQRYGDDTARFERDLDEERARLRTELRATLYRVRALLGGLSPPAPAR